MRFFLLILVVASTALLAPTFAGAETTRSVELHASVIDYYSNRFILTADGNVRARLSDGTVVSGETFSIDLKLNRFLIAGNVHIDGPKIHAAGAALAGYPDLERFYFLPEGGTPDRWTYYGLDFTDTHPGRLAARRCLRLPRPERPTAVYHLQQRDDLSQEQRRVSTRLAHQRAGRLHADARLRDQLLLEPQLLSERVCGRGVRRRHSLPRRGRCDLGVPLALRPVPGRLPRLRSALRAQPRLRGALGQSADPKPAPVERHPLQAPLAGRRGAASSTSSPNNRFFSTSPTPRAVIRTSQSTRESAATRSASTPISSTTTC